jgi:T-complex protein 1 subunit delta
LSKAQDVEAGDGTTSIVVITGELLGAAHKLSLRGIHASAITSAFQKASAKSKELLQTIAHSVDLADEETLIKSATTSLSSKVREAPWSARIESALSGERMSGA